MLNENQLSALKSAALADQTASSYIAAGNDTGLAEWFNVETSHIVWRPSLSPDQSRAAMIEGATQLDGLTASKRDSLFWLASGQLEAQRASVRAAIEDLCGSQNTLKAALIAACKRPATRAEQVLSSGTGTDATPATLGWEGYIDGNTVSLIRESA